ncbi:MAG: 23S rRNA (uracil(1939)-C(5))-methyltransferase RlmD [Coriobacteriia bacterium]|nr:23S rRNA (uracil(1939)-C(5))-methyltransferase RlmD [Coriobacteriia bacterium]
MERAQVTIESLAHGGDGVARLPDGRTVFISYACPGDELTARVTEDHGKWARAVIESVDTASPERVEPLCPYFGACGGCQWQHIAYPRQIAEKRQMLIDALCRIGRLHEPQVDPILPSPSEYGYRNKIELTAGVGSGGLTLGLSRPHTNDVLPVDSCLLLPKKDSRAPKAISGALRFLASRGAAGIVRAAYRTSPSGSTTIDIKTVGGPFPRAAAARVLRESTRADTVTRTIVRDSPGRHDISQVEVLAGDGTWHETLSGDRYAVSSPTFFQVNTAAAAVLRTCALEMLDPQGDQRVADLYAGAGTFTLPVARAAGDAVAVESSRFALSDLRHNLDLAELDADIVPGDAAYALPGLGHLDAALIDPPRAGLSDKAMLVLEAARIQRIVYVSCDPATLARDVARLATAGYRAIRFVPIDLFPQTHHVETVALLELG